MTEPTTDSPKAASVDAAAVSLPDGFSLPAAKVWRDEPCPGCGQCGIFRVPEFLLVSARWFAEWLHSSYCDGTGRVIEPAS